MKKILLLLLLLTCTNLFTAEKKYPVPKPQPIKTDVKIAAYYLTGWGIMNEYKRCQDLSIGTEYNPILGRYKPVKNTGTYNSSDPEIVDWHIKWAVENGINTFIIEYMYPEWNWEKNFEKGFFNSKYFDYINFAIQIDNNPHYKNYENAESKTIEIIDYISKNYFNKKQYYKINGKPVVFFYHAQVFLQKFGKYNLKKLVNLIYKTAEKNGYEIFLAGDVMNKNWTSDNENIFMIKLFDAVTAYNIPDAASNFQKNNKGHSICKSEYKNVIDGYIKITEKWNKMVKNNKKGFIPTVIPGFSNRLLYDKKYDDWMVEWLNPSPEEFQRMCKGIKPYIDKNLNMIIVEAWNELHEGSVLEPTIEKGFENLNVIRNVFGIKENDKYPENIYPNYNK